MYILSKIYIKYTKEETIKVVLLLGNFSFQFVCASYVTPFPDLQNKVAVSLSVETIAPF